VKRAVVMSKRGSKRLQSVPGQARVESRVTVWIHCPLCKQEHHHIVTARDHPELPGQRYWPVDCHGTRYYMGVSSARIAHALALAASIATEYGLSQQWLTQDIDDIACMYIAGHG
jgi:hypothetical protein